MQVSISTVFLLLLIYSFGVAWAKYLPRAEWVEGTRFARLGPTLHFLNPGEFRLKEVRTSLSNLDSQVTDKSVACNCFSGRVHGFWW